MVVNVFELYVSLKPNAPVHIFTYQIPFLLSNLNCGSIEGDFGFFCKYVNTE